MEIVSIERKTFEAMVAKFDRFVRRMDAKTAHEVDYPLVVLVNQFIHVTLDLV